MRRFNKAAAFRVYRGCGVGMIVYTHPHPRHIAQINMEIFVRVHLQLQGAHLLFAATIRAAQQLEKSGSSAA